MNNSGHSLIHESIYESNNQMEKNSKGDYIMYSKVTPIRILDSKKSDMDVLRTGKQHTNQILIPKKGARPQTASKLAQNNISIERNMALKQLERPPAFIDQAQFIQYYEQNIKLKTKQKQMQAKIQSMKNQLYQISQVRQNQNYKELEMLAAGKKSAWDTKDPYKKNKPLINKDKDSAKVSNLLQIIDHYKNKLATSEQQIQNLKRQKYLLEQDTRLKDRKNDLLIKENQNTSAKAINNTDVQEKLVNVTKLLEIQKQRNKYNQVDIKRLETKIRSLQTSKQQMESLRQLNRSLQDQILKLTQLPSFSKVTDKVEEQRKHREVEQENKTLKQKLSKLKTQNITVQADSKVLRDQLIKAHAECQSLESENMKLKERFAGNAILSRLSEEPELLEEVVYQIQRKKNKVQLKTQIQAQNYDKILLQKEMLANELSNLRNKMTALQENWKQKQRLSRIQKQQLAHQYKQQSPSLSLSPCLQPKQTTTKNGIAYTDDISMFTQQTQNIPQSTNYFDLFLGQLNLLQTMMATNFNIRGSQNTLILATIDFYNHNTQTTRPVHGIRANLQSEFSFKVSQDQFFFNYLNRGSFGVEIWGSEGNKRVLLARATVDLKPLILKSRKNMAPVVSSSIPLYINQKVMGSINFVMRLRLPIFEQLQRISELDQLVSSQQSKPRRLIIQIQQGRGFPQTSNTFVYFPFRLEDYYTKTCKGSNPTWNFYKTLQLRYNTDLKNYLRKNQLQFIILDDNTNLINNHNEGDTDSDVIGSAVVSLVPLLESKVIKERLAVVKGMQRVGFVDVRVYWHDGDLGIEGEQGQGEIGGKGLEEIISKFLIKNNLEPEDVFNKIDRNRTGMISFEQFLTWVLKIQQKISLEMANNYYSQFKMPVNLINFTTRLTASKQSQTVQIAKQLSQINKMFSQNTQMIKKKQSLQDFLKDKDVTQVCLGIDISQDGKISRQQLRTYFNTHNIQPPIGSYDKQQVQIVKLMREYQSMK